jgi:predicted nucleotidyltransferase
VFVERGNCTFVTKANYAQLIGAQMLIIQDDVKSESADSFIMYAANGHGIVFWDFCLNYLGNDVNIPVVLISFEDGEKIKQTLMDPNTDIARSVALQVKFPIVLIVSIITYFQA